MTNQYYTKYLHFIIAAMVSLASTATQANETNTMINSHSECDYWGDYALIMLDDYEVRIEIGDKNPIAGTKGMLEYDGTEEGSMGRIYYDQILGAIKAKAGRESIYKQGKEICLKYPEGEFDPNNF